MTEFWYGKDSMIPWTLMSTKHHAMWWWWWFHNDVMCVQMVWIRLVSLFKYFIDHGQLYCTASNHDTCSWIPCACRMMKRLQKGNSLSCCPKWIWETFWKLLMNGMASTFAWNGFNQVFIRHGGEVYSQTKSCTKKYQGVVNSYQDSIAK